MLGQVIENSMKYRKPKASEGGMGFVLEIYGTATENAVQLHVRDNGIGIPASEVDRVFEKGFTGDTGELRGKATGMGLYLASKIAENNKIGIEAKPSENGGFQIELTFPEV